MMTPQPNSLEALSRSPSAPRAIAPLRVVLLGCGTVNGGVLEAAQTRPELGLSVTAILTRRPRDVSGDGPQWTTQLDEALGVPADLVIDALPDTPLAADAINAAIDRGLHVVSANKAVLARTPELETRARKAGVILRYSAAVGGELPVLETIAALRQEGQTITTVRGVLNGTSNYLLEKLHAGEDFAATLAEAQAAGFAEADPSADLGGADAAAKLCLIARSAFDMNVPVETISCTPITPAAAEAAQSAAQAGRRLRQVGVVECPGDHPLARVDLVTVPGEDPLAQTRNEENAVEIVCADGTRRTLHGRGAGRGPTSAAILSDVTAIRAVLATHGDAV